MTSGGPAVIGYAWEKKETRASTRARTSFEMSATAFHNALPSWASIKRGKLRPIEGDKRARGRETLEDGKGRRRRFNVDHSLNKARQCDSSEQLTKG